MHLRRSLLACFCIGVFSNLVYGFETRVLPKGQLPPDVRLNRLKNLNDYFPFRVPKTLAAWKRRQRELRRKILVSAGLWPRPQKTPLQQVIHGKVQRNGFTVEKVYFQSYPGHYVTGLLFRPADGKTGKRPAVLCPHGHGGRLQDHGGRLAALIKSGDEKFPSGRFPKLARCAHLARMGVVTFIFDMIGYADSRQIGMGVAHRLQQHRPHLDTPTKWGLFTVQSELRMQSILGIQTWNSIRALDFLSQLPDVDAKRMAVTGGSGGGTQTILLGAIDPRPIAAFPNGMVSTAMQGGCLCENASMLRVGTGNVELTALFAPRPQGMTAANDWTKEMMTKGYPELQKLYAMYGKKEDVLCVPLLHFGHNYNYVTRAIMYAWFNKHMKLNVSQEGLREKDYKLLESKDLTVWNKQHPVPPGGEAYEVSLTKYLDDESNRQLAKVYPRNRQSLGRYRSVVGGAVRSIVGRAVPGSGSIQGKQTSVELQKGIEVTRELLTFARRREALPIVRLTPKKSANGQVVLWIDGQGKRGVLEPSLANTAVGGLLRKGYSVVTCDLFQQGEFTPSGRSVAQARYTQSSRASAVYTFCYNDSLFVRRVHDVLSLVSKCKDESHKAIHLVGANGAGPVVAVASALLGKSVKKRVIDTQGFRFVNLKSYRDVNFMPGAVKYGDLPGILALSAIHAVTIGGESGQIPKIVSSAFRAAGNAAGVRSVKGDLAALVKAAF